VKWVRRKYLLVASSAAAVAVIGVIVGLVVSATPAAVRKPAPRPSPTPVAAPVVHVRRGPLRSPFTGERVKSLSRVLAVKIDNIIYARPQTGLTAADIIYVIPVEGGLSRFMAIFSSHLPPVIGPVRSARQSDISILRQFGRPAFAFSGAQPNLLPVVEHQRIIDLYAGRVGGYFRGASRPAPYNLYADTRTLLREAKGASKARNIGFTFGAPPPGGYRVKSETVRYPSATFKFDWYPKKKDWLVWVDGARDFTTSGKRLAPSTVVIQYVRVATSVFKEEGLRPPYAITTGSGTALVLRNGRAYKVRWSRPNRNAGTKFTTMDGKPMNFALGQVWVVLTANDRHSYHNERQ
jgi:hypothetical protein